MRLADITENLMGAALTDKLGGTFFAQPDLQKPTSAEPEKDYIRTGGGAKPRKARHRRYMRTEIPKPGSDPI